MTRKQLNHYIRKFAHGTLGFDEEQYRSVIRDVTDTKEHITHCTDEEAQLVLTALQRFHEGRLNVPGRPPTRNGAPARSTGVRSGGERQHSIIPRLMSLLRWDWSDTARFCYRVTRKRDTRSCDTKELSKVIAGMVQIVERDIRVGKLTLAAEDLQKFRMHTQRYRSHHQETV